MPEVIISASGPQYGLVINSDGTIGISGTVAISSITGSIMIGSVSAQVDSIYVQSGDNINISSMPKTEVYGSGTFAISGTVTTTVTTGSEVWVKGGSILMYSGTNYIDVPNRVAGSIVNMPIVGVSGTNFSEMIGSVRAQSIQITNPWIVLGSFAQTNIGSVIQSTSPWSVSGVITVDNRVAGSIVNLPNVVGVSGTYFQDILGSVQVNTGSVRAQVVQVTSPWQIAGSIWSMPDIATGSQSYLFAKSGANYYELVSTPESALVVSVSGLYSAGSLEVFQTTNADMQVQATQEGTWNISTLTDITNRVAGSIVNMPTVTVNATDLDIRDLTATSDNVGIGISTGSVEIWQITNSNLQVQATQETTPWVTSGTSTIAGSAYVTGSVNIATTVIPVSGTLFQNILGSVQVNAGSVAITTNVLGVSGAYFPGSIWFGGGVGSVVISGTPIVQIYNTGSVVISGTSIPPFRGIGSVHIGTGIGSVYVVDINNDNGIVDIGSPNYMRGLLTASGTYTNVWRQPPNGSRVEMHGFHISSNNAGYVRLCVSGTTPVVISDWNLNYVSGATIEKTFVNPIIPGPATTPLGIGATVAGSTLCTIYGREVK